MRILIQRIHPEGIEIDESYPIEWTGLTQKDAVRFIAPIEAHAIITKIDDEVFAEISTTSRYESCCDRCLKDLRQDWHGNFKIVFDVDKQMEFVDMDEDIRQEIILNLPTRVLCQEECKGLCIDCGANLNDQECKHVHSVVSQKV